MTSSEGESESQRLEPEDRGEVAVTSCQRDAESQKLEEIATRERLATLTVQKFAMFIPMCTLCTVQRMCFINIIAVRFNSSSKF